MLYEQTGSPPGEVVTMMTKPSSALSPLDREVAKEPAILGSVNHRVTMDFCLQAEGGGGHTVLLCFL